MPVRRQRHVERVAIEGQGDILQPFARDIHDTESVRLLRLAEENAIAPQPVNLNRLTGQPAQCFGGGAVYGPHEEDALRTGILVIAWNRIGHETAVRRYRPRA